MPAADSNLFADPSRWTAYPSGEASLGLSSDSEAMRWDYDFKAGKGFVVGRCALQRAMPAQFTLRFTVRGRCVSNALEVKLIDGSGQNVWRFVKAAFRPSLRAREMALESQDFVFAWGPRGGGPMKFLSYLEIAIVAGEGGSGTLWFSDFSIEDHDLKTPPLCVISGGEAPVLSVRSLRWWKPEAHETMPCLTLDFHEARLFGGFVIRWDRSAPRSGFRIQTSSDAKRWRTIRTLHRARGGMSHLYLPNTRCRYLRLILHEPVNVREFTWEGFEFSRSIEAFWHGVAARETPGAFPRWLYREQSLWTVIGSPEGNRCALMNEEGMMEIAEGGVGIEPFLCVDDHLFSWAFVERSQSLRDGWKPEPVVTWDHSAWSLRIEASASSDGAVRARYTVENRSDKLQRHRLFVAIRPFQVCPPWQRFREVGGISQIRDLQWNDGVLSVNQTPVFLTSGACGFTGVAPDDGLLVDALATPRRLHHVHDKSGFASGAVWFEFELEPGTARQIEWRSAATNAAEGSRVLRDLSEDDDPWNQKLRLSMIEAPGSAAEAIQVMHSCVAHVLVTRAGAALQPGPRRYTRSWIRDGAIMSAALLRMGCVDEVREFIRWYAPHIRDDGFVPCCVDRAGPDWLVEHDSHGQWLALIADYFRFSNDRRLAEELWPSVQRVAAFIERLIEPEGVLPVSVSHEGYLAQPVHSYWDDFWAVRGLRDLAMLARSFGGEADHWERVARQLEEATRQDIAGTRARRQLDFIPGSREWADFDATATASAVTLLDLATLLGRDAVMATFDKYLFDWRRKHTGMMAWENYTAYEIRIIGALVRLGRREDALELLEFFLPERRPLAWNQWPEITWRDAKAPAHIGDVPHTWIGAEYVLALRSLFAYETDQTLVVAAGVAAEWTSGEGVRVQSMPTTFGQLSYTLRNVDSERLVFEIKDGLVMPSSGIWLRAPGLIRSASLNNDAIKPSADGAIEITVLPARVELTLLALS